MTDPAGITLSFVRHPDGNPLHWLLSASCPHGDAGETLVVGRRQVILDQADLLKLNYRLGTGCGCRVLAFSVAT